MEGDLQTRCKTCGDDGLYFPKKYLPVLAILSVAAWTFGEPALAAGIALFFGVLIAAAAATEIYEIRRGICCASRAARDAARRAYDDSMSTRDTQPQSKPQPTLQE